MTRAHEGVPRVPAPAPYANMSIFAGLDPSDVARAFSVYGDISSNQTLRVGEWLPTGELTDGPFSILVIC